MKKTFCLISFSLLLCLTTINGKAAGTGNTVTNTEINASMTAEQKQARIEAITTRVNEIKNMDRSQLSNTDRKALRMELRALKHESRRLGSGIYLSLGAVVIIVLLLISVRTKTPYFFKKNHFSNFSWRC
jgi:hypothetical protein